MDDETRKFLEAGGFNFAALTVIADRYLDDAIQEACLAICEGRNPNTAIVDYCRRELQNDARRIPATQLGETPIDELAVDYREDAPDFNAVLADEIQKHDARLERRKPRRKNQMSRDGG